MRFSQCRLVFTLFFIHSVLSVLVNVTIDDTFADPMTGNHIDYSPSTSWNISANCIGCTSAPDPSQVYDKTWHTGTFSQSSPSPLLASVPFYGNAVYVYCVLSQSENSPESLFLFFIDMEPAGNFTYQPLGQAGFQYNALVFSTNSLPMTNHTLTIQNGHTGVTESLILLDYIVYSYDDGTTRANTSAAVPQPQPAATPSSTSRVVGAVLGTLFALLIIGLALVAYLRYKKGQPVLPTFRSPRGKTNIHSRKGSSSFNPQLFVRTVVNKVSTSIRRASRPPPKSGPQVSQMRHYSTELPYLSDPPLTGGTARSSPAPLLAAAYGLGEPRYPSGSTFSSKMESIHRWQLQTMEETKGLRIQSINFSEELSSYYDDNATESHRVRTPPPPPRRYTVMNN